MQPKHNAIYFFIICISAVLLICACGTNDSASNAHTDESPTAALPAVVYELDLSAQQDVDLSVLANYPELQRLNLNGLGLSDVSDVTVCTDLQWLDLRGNAIDLSDYARLHRSLPACEILWDVPIGNRTVDCTVQEITLTDDDAGSLAKLTYLPELTHVDASAFSDQDELLAIRRLLPDCQFNWVVDICQTKVSGDTTVLDLSAADGVTPEMLRNVKYLDSLETIDLRGTLMPLEGMDAFTELYSNIKFLFTFELAGIETDSTAQELDISRNKINDIDRFRAYLKYLPELSYLDMCYCGLNNETMASLREDFPSIKFVWVVRLAQYSLRTDTIAWSTLVADNVTPRISSADIEPLKYCTDLEALDLGHNRITDISVLSNLKKLRVLILADNLIADISPLAELEELRYVELFTNFRIENAEPLAGLTNLIDLNLSYTSITDFSPLYSLKNLQRLWINGYNKNPVFLSTLAANLPEGCEIGCDYVGGVRGGWRENERHFMQAAMFRGNYVDEWFYQNP